MLSVGLETFDRLVELTNAIVALRDARCPEGCDQWTALTLVVYVLDTLIDAVVMTFPVEDDLEAVYPESPESKEP